MSRCPRDRFRADAGIATTGMADSTAPALNATDTVYLGLALGDHLEAREVRLPGDRRRIRQFGVISALNLLRLRLIGSDREVLMR